MQTNTYVTLSKSKKVKLNIIYEHFIYKIDSDLSSTEGRKQECAVKSMNACAPIYKILK